MLRRLLLGALLAIGCASAQAASVTYYSGASSATTAASATYTSGSFTPTAGHEIFVICAISGTATDPASVTSSIGGDTYTQISSTARGAANDLLFLFAADQGATGSAQTVTCDVTGDNGSGGMVAVFTVDITERGASAIRDITGTYQIGEASSSSPSTAAPAFPASALTGNPTLGCMFLASNPATVTEPSGWTEDLDTGYDTPSVGMQCVHRNSGFTSTTITWGSSETNYGVFIVELDTAASAPTFSAGPSPGTFTTTTMPFTYTSDTTGTVKGVVCPDGQTYPTVSQVIAGNCTGDVAAAATVSESVTAGVAGGQTFTGLSASTTYDVHFAIDAATDSAAIDTVANQTTSATPSSGTATFFWTCESTTLGANDYSAGDTTASATGTMSISSTFPLKGSNSCLTTDNGDYYVFSSASIAAASEGSMGILVRYLTSIPTGTAVGIPLAAKDSADNDQAGFSSAVDEVRGFVRQQGGSTISVTTTTVNLIADTTYFVTMAWDISGDREKVAVYDANCNLIQQITDTVTDLAGALPGGFTDIRVGNQTSHTGAMTLDTVVFASDYDAPVADACAWTSFYPTFTAALAAGTHGNTTLQVTYTPDQAGTAYGVACPDGATASHAQALAGNCSSGAAPASWTETGVAGVGESKTFTGLSAGTTYDVFVTYVNSLGGAKASVSSLADQTTTSTGGSPTFDDPPHVTSRTESTYTIGYDTAGAGNFFVGAYVKGSSAPSCNNIEAGAGTGYVVKATEAATNSADTIVLSISGGDPFPYYDLFACAEDGGGTNDSSVVSMLAETLTEPSGRNYITKSGSPSVGQIGAFDDASPAIADGDIMDVSEYTNSNVLGTNAHTLTVAVDTTYTVDSDGDTSRQTFTRRFYDVSVGAWSDADPVLYCANNVAAEYQGPQEFEGDVPYLFEKDAAVDFALDALWTDAEGDELTHNILNLPSGLSEDGEEVTGTPTTFGYYSTVELQVFDACNDETDETVTFVIGLRLPDVTSWLLDESLWKSRSIFTGAAANAAEYETFLPRAANY